MAKKRNYKSLESLNVRLQSELGVLRKSTVESLDKRILGLESELRDSISLAMSMIAVNKELINRLQEKEQTGTTTKADNGKVSSQDTSADILGKIYNFFVKGSERDKRNFEIQRDFAEERSMESKRRKPIRKSTASKVYNNKPSSNPIMDLLGFIGAGIGNIFKFITGGLFEIIGKGLSGIKNVIMGIKDFIFNKIHKIPIIGTLMKLGEGVFESIFSALGFLGSTVKGILSVVTGLGGFVVATTYKVLKTAGGLIFRTIWPVISKILEKAFAGAGLLTKAVTAVITNPLGALATAGLVAYEAYKDEGIADKEERLYFGDEVFELKKRKIQLQKELDRTVGTGINPQRDEARKKEIAEIDAKLPAAYDKYLNEVVTPAMENAGYKKELVYDIADPGGPGVIAFRKINEKGEEEQVLYRGAGESKDEDGKVRYSLTATEERFSPAKIVQPTDKAIIEKNVIGEKISQGIEEKAESAKSSLISSASQGISDLSGGVINESTIKEGFNRLEQMVTPSSNLDVAPLSSESISSPGITPSPTTPITAAPAPQSIPTPIPNLQSYDQVDVGTTQVINMPTQTNATKEQQEFYGSPSVRNPNPVVYRTAILNDQAQP